MQLTTHIRLVQRLRMGGDVPLLLPRLHRVGRENVLLDESGEAIF